MGDEAYLFVRPESLKFDPDDEFDNVITATVAQQEFEGNLWQVHLELAGGRRLSMSTVNDGRDLGHASGTEARIGFRADLAVALSQGPLAAGE